jgi:hypothetical protein
VDIFCLSPPNKLRCLLLEYAMHLEIRRRTVQRRGILARFPANKMACIVILLWACAVTGCGEREHGMRVSAIIIQLLLSRVILTEEKVGWFRISNRPIINCDNQFRPKHCLPAKNIAFEKTGAVYVATYRISVGSSCNAIEPRLRALRDNPRRLFELYDPSGADMLGPDVPAATTVEASDAFSAWQTNEQFNPDNKKKFVMGHYIGLIKRISIDCGNGTAVLQLAVDR